MIMILQFQVKQDPTLNILNSLIRNTIILVIISRYQPFHNPNGVYITNQQGGRVSHILKWLKIVYLAVKWGYFTWQSSGSILPSSKVGVLYLAVKWGYFTWQSSGGILPGSKVGVLYLAIKWGYLTWQ